MDDRFLHQLQEVPDSEFVNNLHRKLSQNYRETDPKINTNFFDLIIRKRLAQVIAILIVSLIVIMTISPVRAFASSLIAYLGGHLFVVTEDYPGDNFPGNVEIINPQVMSLSDALVTFPYKVHLPTNIPSGYILNEDNVRVYINKDAGLLANTILFEWTSSNSSYLILTITDRDSIISEIVAPDSVEEILLDENHPAVLIRGGWDADNKVWSDDVGYRLRWSVDNLVYDLMGDSREQLIDIARSTIK